MEQSESWYIVKQANEQCAIMTEAQMKGQQESASAPMQEHWGPYGSQQEAIARRVGLIRAGKCQPV